jgi:hypothetical protein
MKYQVDQWVIYDPWRDHRTLNNPKKAIILYVYKKNERSLYDYEIYIDENPGIYKKVRESALYPVKD